MPVTYYLHKYTLIVLLNNNSGVTLCTYTKKKIQQNFHDVLLLNSIIIHNTQSYSSRYDSAQNIAHRVITYFPS